MFHFQRLRFEKMSWRSVGLLNVLLSKALHTGHQFNTVSQIVRINRFSPTGKILPVRSEKPVCNRRRTVHAATSQESF
jgi:hypothetical protein